MTVIYIFNAAFMLSLTFVIFKIIVRIDYPKKENYPLYPTLWNLSFSRYMQTSCVCIFRSNDRNCRTFRSISFYILSRKYFRTSVYSS